MRARFFFLGMFLLILALSPSFAASVTVTQSGSDPGSVIKGDFFTITVSGLSGSGTVNLIDTPTGFSSEEGTSKAFSEGTTSVIWTTAKISLIQTSIKMKASISVQGSPTIAESSSFNVVLPPSITLEASPSAVSVDEDSDYSVTLSVENLGGTSAKSIIFSVFGTGMSASCPTISSVTSGGSSSVTCTVTATQSGTIATSFTAAPSNCDSKSDSITVTVASSSQNLSNTSRGSGGSGSYSSYVETNTTSNLTNQPLNTTNPVNNSLAQNNTTSPANGMDAGSCTEGSLRCLENNLETCVNGAWSIKEVCESGCDAIASVCNSTPLAVSVPEAVDSSNSSNWWIYGLVIAVIALALAVIIRKRNSQRI